MIHTPEKKSKSKLYDYSNIMEFEHGDFVFGLNYYRTNTLYGLSDHFRGALTVDKFNFLQFYFVDSHSKEEIMETVTQLVRDKKLDDVDHDRLFRFMDILFNTSIKNHYDLNRKLMEDLENKWLSRSCKASIMMAYDMDTKIHFILDGLDQKEVVSKCSENYNSYTSIELRSIFKLSIMLDIGNFIVFYKNGVIVPAPWENNNPLWLSYRNSKA